MNPNRPGPLRAALFTDADVFAGTERHMLDLARGLRAAGVQPTLVSPSISALADRAREDGIEHIAIEKGGFIDWPAISTLRAKLRAGELDIIHAHNGRTALSAALAVKLAGRGAYVLTQHFLIPTRATRGGLKGAVSNTLHRWISRGAGHVIAISDATRDGIVQRGESTGNVTTIPNGIPTPDLQKLIPPAKIRDRYGISATRPLIVCAARLEKEKDVASLIDAMPEIAAAVPGAYCLVAGGGSLHAELEERIQDRGVSGSVHLAGFCEDALSIINAGDVFVLPSLAEPFGLVIIEAMSLGKAVVSTDAGGPREIVRPGVTGLLVPPSSPADLATAISRLLSDKSLCSAMGEAGRARFEEKYTLSRMTADIHQAYLNALGRKAELIAKN